jgi:hypothetical protein
MLCCFVKSHAEVDDTCIHLRIKSGRNLVNCSTESGSLQFHLKNEIYDWEANGQCVTKWKVFRNGKKKEQSQFAADRNWPSNLIEHMWHEGILHDIFIDGRPVYRWINAEEREEILNSDDDNGFPSMADGGGDDGDADDSQDNESSGRRFLNFWSKIFEIIRTPMICDAR